MEPTNAETRNLVGATMNKHSLYYHTRLHDWYRQHSIMQEKHSCSHNTYVPPPSLVGGTGHLTADKLNFINDWCSEVNKMFFPIEKKKATKSTRKPPQLKRSFSKDVSKSRDVKPIRTLDTSTLTGKRNRNTKSFTKYTGLAATAAGKAYRPCVGLADRRGYKQYPKKTSLSNLKAGKLDLCIINSTKEAGDDRDGTKFGNDFFTTRRSQLKQKQNDNRFSARFKNSTLSGSLAGNDNMYGYYGFISAIVRNVALYNDNRRGVNNVNDKASNQQAISNNGDEYLQHKLLTSRRENFREPRNSSLSLQQAKKYNIDEKQKASLSFLQDVVRSDDIEIEVTSVSCVDRTHPGNMEHVKNIDPSQSGRSVIENKQDNAPNQISDKENSSNLSTVLAENESIHSIPGVMTNKINYTNTNAFSTQAHSTENRWTSIGRHLSICTDVKNVGHEGIISDSEDIDRSFQNIAKENDTNSEAKTKETHKQCKATIGNEATLSGCYTKEDKQDHMCDLTNEAKGQVSLCAVSNCDENEGELRRRSETPTIGHFCLSNNLLNMLTIDDCKMSQRYGLLKTSDSAKEDMKTSKRIQAEVKEVSNRAVTETSKDARKMKPHLSQSVRAISATNRNNRTDLENGALSFYGLKYSTNLEKGFRVLINNKTSIQRTDQRKTTDGKKIAGVVKTTEGPIYRRLHAALRKQMEEVRPNNCAKLQ